MKTKKGTQMQIKQVFSVNTAGLWLVQWQPWFCCTKNDWPTAVNQSWTINYNITNSGISEQAAMRCTACSSSQAKVVNSPHLSPYAKVGNHIHFYCGNTSQVIKRCHSYSQMWWAVCPGKHAPSRTPESDTSVCTERQSQLLKHTELWNTIFTFIMLKTLPRLPLRSISLVFCTAPLSQIQHQKKISYAVHNRPKCRNLLLRQICSDLQNSAGLSTFKLTDCLSLQF